MYGVFMMPCEVSGTPAQRFEVADFQSTQQGSKEVSSQADSNSNLVGEQD
jgi:hypothetical protein